MLRPATDADLDALGALAVQGIHDPAVQPFGDAWTDKPPHELIRSIHQWEWSRRAAWSPDDWSCMFAVHQDGNVIGVQSISGKNFPVLREVRTGSWLGRRHQNQGLGTDMRTAVLDFAFTGLGALLARTSCHADNGQSQTVNWKLGYTPNGSRRIVVRGNPVREDHFTVNHIRWSGSPASGHTEITGLEDCLEMFGADKEER